MEEKTVVEVEVLSETESEVVKNDEPKKNVTYVSKGDKGLKNLRLADKISRYCFPGIFLFAAGGLVFSILYSQGPELYRLVLLAIFFGLSCLCFLTSILGFLLARRGKRQIEEDRAK